MGNWGSNIFDKLQIFTPAVWCRPTMCRYGHNHLEQEEEEGMEEGEGEGEGEGEEEEAGERSLVDLDHPPSPPSQPHQPVDRETLKKNLF